MKKIKRTINRKVIEKRKQRKYNVPVIGHFVDKSIRFNSINQASNLLGIHYHLIFEACVGKIKRVGGISWEYENGMDWLRYKAYYIRIQQKYTRYTGITG